jgi:phosphoglycerate dehydrogenase-like enzyme
MSKHNIHKRHSIHGGKEMKIVVIGKEGRFEKFSNPTEYAQQEFVYAPIGSSDDDILKAGHDAQIIIVDAMGTVSEKLINNMPNLKMIHSEGVGYQGVNVEAARKNNIYVCNCKGMNAIAVAEHAIMLMLSMLRFLVVGDSAVRNGKQITAKEQHMASGDLKELSECTIGFVGYGDIAKETARLASVFGADLIYYKPSGEEESDNIARYMPLDELLAKSDIVSLHLPVKSDTIHIVNKDFFAKMKKGSILINTARGELVDSAELINAIQNGTLSGAGLDCIEGEPVLADNILLKAGKEVLDKIVFSPHIAGVTKNSFSRGYKMLWSNIHKIESDKKPDNIVWEK